MPEDDSLHDKVAQFRSEVVSEWQNNIAPFWLSYAPDEKYGGFRGWITNNLEIDDKAEKGIILNSRILWTFSRAFNLYKSNQYLEIATRAYQYIADRFVDQEFGGVYWTLDYTGESSDTKKRTYAQAFAIYGLSEYYLATRDSAALALATRLFNVIETNCRDRVNDGYFETFERDWTPALDQRLSEVDQDDKKSMNAHLHVLESYASLAQASGDTRVKERLREVVSLFIEHVVHPNRKQLIMFFDEEWNPTFDVRSFGHDIEASWLLFEAAEFTGDHSLIEESREIALSIAASVADQGLDSDGSLLYEAKDSNIIEDDKDWWVQAEAVVGFTNAWQLSGEQRFLDAAVNAWAFIKNHIVDREHGEWFWKVARDCTPSNDMPKLSQWKCPYHNGRMCFEIDKRLNEI